MENKDYEILDLDLSNKEVVNQLDWTKNLEFRVNDDDDFCYSLMLKNYYSSNMDRRSFVESQYSGFHFFKYKENQLIYFRVGSTYIIKRKTIYPREIFTSGGFEYKIFNDPLVDKVTGYLTQDFLNILDKTYLRKTLFKDPEYHKRNHLDINVKRLKIVTKDVTVLDTGVEYLVIPQGFNENINKKIYLI